MRKKNTPVRVVDISKNQESKRNTMKYKTKIKKSVKKKVKHLSKFYRKSNKLSHLIFQIKPCSIILKRCDEQVLAFKARASISQDVKRKSISMTLKGRPNANATNIKKFSLASSKTAQLKKAGLKLSQIVSRILKKKKTQKISPVSHKNLTSGLVGIHKRRKHKRFPFSFPGSSDDLELSDTTTILPCPLVLKKSVKAISDVATNSNFEHIIHNYARPSKEVKINEIMENACVVSCSTSRQGNSQGQDSELPLSKKCEECGHSFNISSFLMEPQNCLEESLEYSFFTGEKQFALKSNSYVLRPERFNSINVCLSASTPVPFQLESSKYVHCSYCPMMYLKTENLQSHERVHHFPCKALTICKYCFQVFHSKWGVIRHVQRMHSCEILSDGEFTSSLFVQNSTNELPDVVNDIYIYNAPYNKTSLNIGTPCDFIVNVPNIGNAFLGTKVTMFSHCTYSSYLVKLTEDSKECVSILPHKEDESDNEWLSYINTCHQHNYPSDEHNYAFIPPVFLCNNYTPCSELENGVLEYSQYESNISSLGMDDTLSHYLDDGIVSKNHISSVSHVEEVEENVSIMEDEEDFCISLSPDIVKYISKEEQGQISLQMQDEYKQETMMDLCNAVPSYSGEKHSSQITSESGLQNELQNKVLKRPVIFRDYSFPNRSLGRRVNISAACTTNSTWKDEKIQSQHSKDLNFNITSISPVENKTAAEGSQASLDKFQTNKNQSDLKYFKCKPCQKPFLNKEELTKHMLDHVRWRCAVCKMIFKSRNTYEGHMQIAHGICNAQNRPLNTQHHEEKKREEEEDNLKTKLISSYILLDNKISNLKKSASVQYTPKFEMSNSSKNIVRLSGLIPARKTYKLDATLSLNSPKELHNSPLNASEKKSTSCEKNTLKQQGCQPVVVRTTYLKPVFDMSLPVKREVAKNSPKELQNCFYVSERNKATLCEKNTLKQQGCQPLIVQTTYMKTVSTASLPMKNEIVKNSPNELQNCSSLNVSEKSASKQQDCQPVTVQTTCVKPVFSDSLPVIKKVVKNSPKKLQYCSSVNVSEKSQPTLYEKNTLKQQDCQPAIVQTTGTKPVFITSLPVKKEVVKSSPKELQNCSSLNVREKNTSKLQVCQPVVVRTTCVKPLFSASLAVKKEVVKKRKQSINASRKNVKRSAISVESKSKENYSGRNSNTNVCSTVAMGVPQNVSTSDEFSRACLRDDGRYYCNLCSSNFPNLLSFQEHSKCKHRDFGQMKCPSCPALFNYRSELRIHCRLHSDESAIICAVCMWTFGDKDNFLSHYMVRHMKPWTHRFRKHSCVFNVKPCSSKNTDMVLYKCGICEVSYLRIAGKSK